MARHNRDAKGADQRGFEYEVSYQPDWVRQIKVTRTLESGRQSTKTLVRNPTPREQPPGPRIRTRVTSPVQDLDFEITVHDPDGVVKRVIVETEAPGAAEAAEDSLIVFSIEDRNPPPPEEEDEG